MAKLNSEKFKGLMGVFGKVALVATAVGAVIDVLAADKQAKTIDKLVKDVAELQSKNS